MPLSVNSAQDFVLRPLAIASANNPSLAAALHTHLAGSPVQQQRWVDAFVKALNSATVRNRSVVVKAGNYGPLARMLRDLLVLAQTRGLDGYLLSTGQFYQTDYTLPILFMGDGSCLASLAQTQHLVGDQRGMMNEIGSYPGQS